MNSPRKPRDGVTSLGFFVASINLIGNFFRPIGSPPLSADLKAESLWRCAPGEAEIPIVAF